MPGRRSPGGKSPTRANTSATSFQSNTSYHSHQSERSLDTTTSSEQEEAGEDLLDSSRISHRSHPASPADKNAKKLYPDLEDMQEPSRAARSPGSPGGRSPRDQRLTRRGIHSPQSPRTRPETTSFSPGGRQKVQQESASPVRDRPKSPSRHQQQKTATKGTPDVGNQNDITAIAFIGLLTLVMILIVTKLFVPLLTGGGPSDSNKVPTGRAKIVADFESGFKEIRSSFPGQDIRFWKGVKSSTNAVLRQDEPDRPSVVMVAVVNDNTVKKTSDCVVQKLSTVINAAYGRNTGNVLSIPIPEKEDRTPGEVKMAIDDQLDTGFNSGSKVVVVNNLERLHSVAAMMFHSYCDNDYANFKDVHIIFTVHLDQDFTEGGDVDGKVENFLMEKWKNTLEIDQFSALWSRIGNNMVMVKAESEDTLNSQCKDFST